MLLLDYCRVVAGSSPSRHQVIFALLCPFSSLPALFHSQSSFHLLYSVSFTFFHSAQSPFAFTFTDFLICHVSYLIPCSASPMFCLVCCRCTNTEKATTICTPSRFLFHITFASHLHFICTSHSRTTDTPSFLPSSPS